MAKRFQRGRRRFFRRAKRELIWTYVRVRDDVVDNSASIGFIEYAIVTKIDWARDPTSTSNLQKGCTLLRIVGDVTISMPFNASPPDPARQVECMWVLRKKDEDDTTIYDSTDIWSEDLLHTEHCTIGFSLSAVATLTWQDGNQRFMRFPLDIRTKRKLTSDDEIVLAVGAQEIIATPGDGTVSVTAQLRSLLQLP